MNDYDKISNWCSNFRIITETICSQYNEPERSTFIQNLGRCENDYLFYMLIINSVNENNKEDFINQSQLFNQWKQYVSSQNSFSQNVFNCKNDHPCYPQNFRAFIEKYSIFNFKSSHFLHIPQNFSFFFHTLLSSWKEKMFIPLGMRSHAMTILDLWANFQNQIKERTLLLNKENKSFYLHPGFNLKLFMLLFNIETELIEKTFRDKNETLCSNAYLAKYFLSAEYLKIEETISLAQQYICCPSLEMTIINDFQTKLNKIYYTSSDLRNDSLLIKDKYKSVKYADYNDKTIDKLLVQLHVRFQNLKNFFKEKEEDCTNTFDYNGINIIYLKPDNPIEKYANSLQNELNNVFFDIDNDIKNAEQSLIQNQINPTLSLTISRSLDLFYNNLKNIWEDAYDKHINLLKYNNDIFQAKQNSIDLRRKISMIEQNANSFHPIDDFFRKVQEQLSKLPIKIQKLSEKEPVPSSVYEKQEQIDSLCLQVDKLILPYVNLVYSLNTEISSLQCSAESLFTYLYEQQYFEMDQN